MKQYLLFETEEIETSAEVQDWGTFKWEEKDRDTAKNKRLAKVFSPDG